MEIEAETVTKIKEVEGAPLRYIVFAIDIIGHLTPSERGLAVCEDGTRTAEYYIYCLTPLSKQAIENLIWKKTWFSYKKSGIARRNILKIEQVAIAGRKKRCRKKR